MMRRAVSTAHREIVKRAKAGQCWFLFEQHNPCTRNDRAAALVRFDTVGEQLEQGSLAGAVAPNQGKPVALADKNVQIPEQPARPLDETKAFIGKNGGRHCRFPLLFRHSCEGGNP